ncbi:MAG: hypothetical protein KF851_17175 [Pirellulaceae bacterium]|nr:hypothetical protein [Pirellulaceae bacterium]
MLFRVGFFALVVIVCGVSIANADVSVRQSRTTLNIRGDGAGDEVAIVGLSTNVFTVSVNGATATTYSEVQTIKISMGKGADLVVISELIVDGSVEVALGGDADDEAFVWASSIGGNLVAKGGSFIEVEDCFVNKDLSLQSGANLGTFVSDSIASAITTTVVLGKSTIRGNSKLSDRLFVEGSVLIGKTSVSLGGGNDTAIVLSSIFLGDVGVGLGSGDDLLSVNSVTMGAKVALDGGQGVDTLFAMAVSTIVPVTPKGFENILPLLIGQ